MGWPEQRASDADRNQTAEKLRTALTDGRLDFEEYDQRLQKTYAAKTYGDLEAIIADLPPPTLAEQARLAERELDDLAAQRSGQKPYGNRRNSLIMWATLAVICLGIWAVISIAAGRFAYFWPIWVIVPLGFMMLTRSGRRRR